MIVAYVDACGEAHVDSKCGYCGRYPDGRHADRSKYIGITTDKSLNSSGARLLELRFRRTPRQQQNHFKIARQSFSVVIYRYDTLSVTITAVIGVRRETQERGGVRDDGP